MPGSDDQNLSVVRRFIDGAVNGRDLSVVDQTWSDDLRWNGGSLGAYAGKAARRGAASASTRSATAASPRDGSLRTSSTC
jgi:hypothetical protein